MTIVSEQAQKFLDKVDKVFKQEVIADLKTRYKGKYFPGSINQDYLTIFKTIDMALIARPVKGFVAEFGVFKGRTINYISNFVDDTVYGFDSFKGIPEPWHRHKAGTFALDELPEVNYNVKLYEGWFEDTIPQFKKDVKEVASFIHIDSDLYSSCKTVLNELKDRIVPGTIILFDEYYNEINSPSHRADYVRGSEKDAFEEFNIPHEQIHKNTQQRLIKIKE